MKKKTATAKKKNKKIFFYKSEEIMHFDTPAIGFYEIIATLISIFTGECIMSR